MGGSRCLTGFWRLRGGHGCLRRCLLLGLSLWRLLLGFPDLPVYCLLSCIPLGISSFILRGQLRLRWLQSGREARGKLRVALGQLTHGAGSPAVFEVGRELVLRDPLPVRGRHVVVDGDGNHR